MSKKALVQISCFFLFLLVFVVRASAQTDWTFVALTSGGATISIDKSFTQSPDGITRVWQKSVSADDTYILTLMEWNCAAKRFRFVQSALYDEEGIVNRSDKKSSWRSFVPDSTGMLLYMNICEDQKSPNSESNENENLNPSLAQIIVKKADLKSEADTNSTIIRKVALGEKLVLISEEPSGVWYQVFDTKTDSQGWLNGNNFKIIKTGKSIKEGKKVERIKPNL